MLRFLCYYYWNLDIHKHCEIEQGVITILICLIVPMCAISRLICLVCKEGQLLPCTCPREHTQMLNCCVYGHNLILIAFGFRLNSNSSYGGDEPFNAAWKSDKGHVVTS